MAEGLFRHMTHDSHEYEAMSAGVGAVNGLPPSAHAIAALKELGIDISHQRSRALTADLVGRADYIFGMTQGHVDAVSMLYPHTAERAFLLREFDETLDVFEKDISDPIGESYEVYASCRDQIEQGIVSMLKFIEHNNPSSVPQSQTEGRPTFAIGADHAGFELKEALKQYLSERGFRLTDLGTHSVESADYPDYAQVVAARVADHKDRFGLLVCSTGIGMSIAANKVPGVRAACVTSQEGAALSRSHNDANVLCLGSKFTSPEEARRILDVFLDAQFEGGRH